MSLPRRLPWAFLLFAVCATPSHAAIRYQGQTHRSPQHHETFSWPKKHATSASKHSAPSLGHVRLKSAPKPEIVPPLKHRAKARDPEVRKVQSTHHY